MPGLSRANDSGVDACYTYFEVGVSLCTGYTVLRMMDPPSLKIAGLPRATMMLISVKCVGCHQTQHLAQSLTY